MPSKAPSTKKPSPRRAVTKRNSKPVIVYFPEPVVAALNSAAVAQDTDRSKLIRRAVRNLLASLAS